MIIECKKLSGPCACGRVHSMATKAAVIEAGCMRQLDEYMAQAGLTGYRVAIYDTNTYRAKGLVRPHVNQEIILQAEGLRADDDAVASVLQQLSGDAQVLLAMGAGAIHDIARYCANRLGVPFVACPTAASVDGFAGSQCSMLWRGVPAVMPGIAPTLVLADLDVIAQAPHALARGGIGDALSKHTALADWRIACLLDDEMTPCTVAESLLRQAATAAEGACEGLQSGDAGAYSQLMYALILPGLAMQCAGSTLPASGAEHLLCHLMDMLPDTYGAGEPVPHGEQAGACAVAIAALYHSLAEVEDIGTYIKPYKAMDEHALAKWTGPEAAAQLMLQNTPDCLLGISAEKLIRHWQAIRHIALEIPTADALSAMLASVGAKQNLAALGISKAKHAQMLQIAPLLRNQLTLARVTRLIKWRYSSAEASRAPSRSSRYADSAIKRAGKSKAVSASSMR